jgi:hypothetical protein
MSKYFLLILVCLLMSCSEEEIIPEASMLAVEGWIESDGYPVVMVTKTLPVSSEKHNLGQLEDYLVKWAKVSVINQGDTVVLTGKYDKGYFPPYVYTTSKIKGKVGESYKLVVEYKDMYATAITTIPDKPEINSYSVERCADSDTLYQIKACMDLTNRNADYYQFFARVGTAKKQYFASFLGGIDGTASDKHIEFPVYRGHENDFIKSYDEYSPYFSINDTVAVKCCSLYKMEYEFWKTYIESEYLSGAAMLSTTNNLPTNITGGTGYWFGYGTHTAYFIIRDYALHVFH